MDLSKKMDLMRNYRFNEGNISFENNEDLMRNVILIVLWDLENWLMVKVLTGVQDALLRRRWWFDFLDLLVDFWLVGFLGSHLLDRLF